jgi:F-type H+-transporting ATPase subunit b
MRIICRLLLCLGAAFAVGVIRPLPCTFAQDAENQQQNGSTPGENNAGGADSKADGAASNENGASDAGAAASEAENNEAEPDGQHHEADLSHANATGSLEAPEEFKYDLAIYTFIVSVLLLLILLKFAWRPIIVGLKKREDKIARQIEEAHLANQRANQTLQEYQARLDAAAEEVRGLIAEGRREAEASRDKILSEAQEAAQRERERALAEIGAAKNQALSEIAATHVDHAFALARQVVRKEITPDEHAQLIRESLDRFPSNNN